MRGLKLKGKLEDVIVLQVASFTDAWIETDILHKHPNDLASHLLQMRGLKLHRKHQKE